MCEQAYRWTPYLATMRVAGLRWRVRNYGIDGDGCLQAWALNSATANIALHFVRRITLGDFAWKGDQGALSTV